MLQVHASATARHDTGVQQHVLHSCSVCRGSDRRAHHPGDGPPHLTTACDLPLSCRPRSGSGSRFEDRHRGSAPGSAARSEFAPRLLESAAAGSEEAEMARSVGKRSVHKRAHAVRIPKQTSRADTAARGTAKQAKKRAKAERKGELGRLTPGNAKKVVGIAKIVGPAVAPFVVRAVTAARAAYDRYRARRLGVPVDEVGSFTGRGAALHARIAGDAEALRDLRTRVAGRSDEESLAVEQYAERTAARLAELTSVVRAAERMPAARRRAAHRAVHDELGGVEQNLLRRFGVEPR
ncbi:DUF6474 family protein [Saccharopolyspora rosea]|uniref:DUF6474 family protein n=1 Tax=Saccharopolyspora rosea TaxID=524884 RepID=A0ABW3FTW6_9PSEU